MENWQLVVAAFILSLVDLVVIGAFLCYQFSTEYFAWHLCPMIVNRLCEIIAFLCTGGMLPSLLSIVQVPLSLFSITMYANRQQCLQTKLLLAVYVTLLLYEFLVAVLMIKMGRYLRATPERAVNQQHISHPVLHEAPQPYIAFHMFALFAQPGGPPYRFGDVVGPEEIGRQMQSHEGRERVSGRLQGKQAEGIVTVEQPDGKKVMLGKVCIGPSTCEDDGCRRAPGIVSETGDIQLNMDAVDIDPCASVLIVSNQLNNPSPLQREPVLESSSSALAGGLLLNESSSVGRFAKKR